MRRFYKVVVFSKKRPDRFGYELRKVKGLGRPIVSFICKYLGISSNTPVGYLSKFQKNFITEQWQSLLTEGQYLFGIQYLQHQKNYLKALKHFRNYRSRRLANKLPCRGQRTRTNSRTVRKINNK